MAVANWVRELTEEVMGKPPFAVGDIVATKDGRRVMITGGQYWGDHGLSNFWYWKEVLPNGDLSEIQEHGYGWTL